MAQTLRIGSAQAHTTLVSAATAMGNINGTGANEILIDAGYVINEDFSTTTFTSNTGVDTADSLVIRGDGGRFTLNIQASGIALNHEAISFDNVDIVNPTASVALYLYKNKTGVTNFSISSTGGGHAIFGSANKTTFVRDGLINGSNNYAARYVETLERVTVHGSQYGIRDATTATDCLVMNHLYSTGFNTIGTMVNCGSSDASGSVGFTGLLTADTFKDAAGGDFTLVNTSPLIDAGVAGGNIGYDQLTIAAVADIASIAGGQITRGQSFDITMPTTYVAGASIAYVEVWIVDGASEYECAVTVNTNATITATANASIANPIASSTIEIRPVTTLAS
jgi:hypothetical protein